MLPKNKDFLYLSLICLTISNILLKIELFFRSRNGSRFPQQNRHLLTMSAGLLLECSVIFVLQSN